MSEIQKWHRKRNWTKRRLKGIIANLKNLPSSGVIERVDHDNKPTRKGWN